MVIYKFESVEEANKYIAEHTGQWNKFQLYLKEHYNFHPGGFEFCKRVRELYNEVYDLDKNKEPWMGGSWKKNILPDNAAIAIAVESVESD